jgi:lycopene cyclase domain-containing protein
VSRLTYLAVLVGCLGVTAWLEVFLGVRVYRQWRRLLLTLAPTAAVFVAWDLAAIAVGHWRFDASQLVGVVLPGGLPLEELLFFLAIPACSVLAFEAVRRVKRWPAGDEA